MSAWERWPEVSIDGQSRRLSVPRRPEPRPPERAVGASPHDVPVDRAGTAQPDHAELIDLFAALARLRPIQRAALVLVRCHGLTYSEAATVLGINESAVTNHVHRGTRRLREILEVTP